MNKQLLKTNTLLKVIYRDLVSIFIGTLVLIELAELF